MDSSDRTLIDRYLSGRDEEAFRMLVGRYLNFVHAVAYRITANEDLARDVAQTIFIRLAQRAALIPPEVTLMAWLHRSTRSLAVDMVRAEASRKRRELSSTLIPDPMEKADSGPDWSALAPVVDELVDRLPVADRDLLLLRYYRNESHAAIAARLGLTESVARKRAFRAIEKLRVLLGKRGIATSSAALATLLPAHAIPAAPPLLSASVLKAAQAVTPVAPSFLSSLLIAVNTSQKIAFSGSLLLLFAATGYTLSPGASSSQAAPGLSGSLSPPDHPAYRPEQVRTRSLRAVPATTEERMERLRAIMGIASTADRHAQLIAWLDALPPALFRETEEFLIAAGKDRVAVMLAASAWAKADLEAALEFAAMQEDGSFGDGMDSQILQDWELVDPGAALKWAATKSRESQENVNAMLGRIARRTPEEVGKLIRDLPAGDAKIDAFARLIANLEHEPELFQRMIAGATESQKAVIYGGISSSSDTPKEAIAILKEHPEAVPFANPDFMYHMWALTDMDAASASVAELPPGEFQNKGIFGLIQGAAEREPAKALELMDQFPALVPEASLPDIILLIGASDPDLALRQAARIHDAFERDSTVATQLKAWLKQDAAAAAEWLEDNPQPESVLKRLPSEY